MIGFCVSRLNGRKCVSLPGQPRGHVGRVVIHGEMDQTAVKNGSRVSRRRYWAMACWTFCPVKWFFNSSETMGRPLSRITMSTDWSGRFGGEVDLPHDGEAVALITGLMLRIAARRTA